MRTKRNLLLGAAAILASSTLAFAQETPEMPEQMTEDPNVAADAANHIAILAAGEGAGDATGAAWFSVDPQNNTINWTVEYTGVEAISATIVCGENDDPAVTLAEDEMASPLEGEASDVSQDVFEAIVAGECAVVIATGEGGAELRGDIISVEVTGGGGM